MPHLGQTLLLEWILGFSWVHEPYISLRYANPSLWSRKMSRKRMLLLLLLLLWLCCFLTAIQLVQGCV